MEQQDSVVIAPGETVRFSTQFSPNIVLSNLRTTLVLTDKRIIVRRPNTIFGLIPLGYSDRTSPIEFVAEVGAGESVSTRNLLLGALSGLTGVIALVNSSFLGFGSGFSALLGLVLIGTAVYLFVTAYSIGIFFRNHGGGVMEAGTGRGERHQLETAKQQLDILLFGDRTSTAIAQVVPTEQVTIEPEALKQYGVSASSLQPLPATNSSTAAGASRPLVAAAFGSTNGTPVSISKNETAVAESALTVETSSSDATSTTVLPRPTASPYTAGLASNPSTSQTILSQIAEHAPELRPLVAANPSAYPGLLDWLRALGDDEVDRALDQRGR